MFKISSYTLSVIFFFNFGLIFSQGALASEDAFPVYFKGTKDHCLMIYNVTKNVPIYKSPSSHCHEAFPPSTNFMFVLTFLALHYNLINSETQFIWDGTHFKDEKWNRNQSVDTWVKNSVLWGTQKVVAMLPESFSADLHMLGFGNSDISSGLDSFWLSDGSLEITPEQQLLFMQRFSKGEFTGTWITIEQELLLRKLFFFEEVNGWTIMGKAGAGNVSFDNTDKFGWFVGEVSKGTEKIVVVAHTAAEADYYENKCPGCKTRGLVKAIVSELFK